VWRDVKLTATLPDGRTSSQDKVQVQPRETLIVPSFGCARLLFQ